MATENEYEAIQAENRRIMHFEKSFLTLESCVPRANLLRVLIVEDDFLVSLFLSEALQDLGYENAATRCGDRPPWRCPMSAG